MTTVDIMEEEFIKKLPGFLGKVASVAHSPTDFDAFVNVDSIKLRMHYDMWKQRIRTASQHNTVLSNGWAFSTMSGLASFEAFVRSDEQIRHIYFDTSGEIERTLDAISTVLPRHNRKFSGAMIYGYGNLLREAYVIEQAKTDQLLGHERIYMIDCSLFYHLFAESPINPLRRTMPAKQLRPILLDLFEGDVRHDKLVYIRDDLINQSRPVLHLFLGNTFCNVDSEAIYRILNITVRPGDFVVAEYANYTPEFFASDSSDYVNQLATRAAAELFAVAEDAVETSTVYISGNAKALSIKVADSDTGATLTYQSMLRRKFQPSELTDKDFMSLSSHHVLNGALNLDAYRRLQNPSA